MANRSAATAERITALGPWFHNLHFPDGSQTAPNHPFGDFPARIWRELSEHLPSDLRGWTALDIGCNAGYYSFELARRGAEVTAIDHDPHYLRQAQWAAQEFGHENVEFRQMQVYELAREKKRYDLVWFMGVAYHLRYPLLALDIVARKVKRQMVFQTMTMPGDTVTSVPDDFGLDERYIMLDRGWPVMAFIEKQLAGDPTNWWAANHACVEAMLRSSRLRVTGRPMPEVYLCEPDPSAMRYPNRLIDVEYKAATGYD